MDMVAGAVLSILSQAGQADHRSDGGAGQGASTLLTKASGAYGQFLEVTLDPLKVLYCRTKKSLTAGETNVILEPVLEGGHQQDRQQIRERRTDSA